MLPVRGRVDEMSRQIRLPDEGPVHVSVDATGALMITVPLSTRPGEDAECCDAVAKLLMDAPPLAETVEGVPSFYVESGEARFLTKQLRNRTWNRVVLVNYMADRSTQTRDIPGPFVFGLDQASPYLTLYPMRA